MGTMQLKKWAECVMQCVIAGLAKINGVIIDTAAVHSNIVIFALAPSDLSEEEFLTGLEQHRVRMIQFGPRMIRAVMHWQINDADISAAIAAVAAVIKQGPSLITSAMKTMGLVGNGYGSYGCGRPIR